MSIEKAAERCINVLLELIQTKVNYVVQEAIIVIKDIFRRYPNRWANSPVPSDPHATVQAPLPTVWPDLTKALSYEWGLEFLNCRSEFVLLICTCLHGGGKGKLKRRCCHMMLTRGVCGYRYESIIATLCENLDTLDEPEAKASMIWIIGEYAERIDNADELLEQFLETFPEETALVQLQLVTAAVKLFLKKPTEKPQQMIQLVLTYATQVQQSQGCIVKMVPDHMSSIVNHLETWSW